jgi:hypothetical protein
MKALGTLAAVAMQLYHSAVLAAVLPKSAEPMTVESIKFLYAGNSAIWKDSDIYFAPDGSAKGIFGKPMAKAAIEGTWSVSDNKICVYTFRSKMPGSFCDCYQWWRDGKSTISLWSTRSDGSIADATNGYQVDEEKNLKPGDLISVRYGSAPGF